MGTKPSPHTWTAGDDATSTFLQTLTDSALYLLNSATAGGSFRPLARLRQATAQSLPTSAAWTAITFDTEDDDLDSGHSTSSSTDQYVNQTAGRLLLMGGAGYAASATGARGARFTLNGAAIAGSAVLGGNNGAGVICGVAARAKIVSVAVNDIIRLEGRQDSGGALNTLGSANADFETSLDIYFLGN